MTSDGRGAERGVILVWFAVLLVVLLGMTALVVDLGALRGQHRNDRAAADFAAAAGARLLATPNDGSGVAACERAWELFLDNAGNPTVTGAPDCESFTGSCDSATTARSATGTAGPFVVTITHPVPDDDGLMQGTSGPLQGVDDEIDGSPCERLGVQVERDRTHSFAQVLGFATGSTDVHSVGRGGIDVVEDGTAALLLLERTDCNALRSQGGGKITIRESAPDDEGNTSPGYIVSDSDGSNCPSGTTLTAGGGGHIRADSAADGQPGEIRLFALEPGATVCVLPACHPDAVPSNISPQPTGASFRIGRMPVDHRYNCKTSYDDLPAPWVGPAAVPPCPGATTATGPIDDLVNQYSGPAGVAPAGFSTYPRPATSDSCNVAAGTTLEPGNWYFNCPGGLQMNNSLTVTGNAVFQGGVSLQSNAILTVGDGSGPRVLYVRSGEISKGGQAGVDLDQVLVYLEDGNISFQGGGGLLRWGAPSSGDFAGLALWSESTRAHTLAGSSAAEIRGVFFAPNAGYAGSSPFSLSGGSSGEMVAEAQFITHRLNVTGGALLSLRPNLAEAVPVLFTERARLIR